jgi:isoleucyl-tRNA synthetase
MHAVSTMLFGRAPFRNVVVTGNILAEDGSKMSKSKNNFPDPWVLIEKYGIDALRFYLLTCPVMSADDVNFSEKSVQEISRKINLLLYNIWSFHRMYTKEKYQLKEAPVSPNILDKWILSLLNQAASEVTKYLDSYNTVKAGKILIDFISHLSTWYLRRSRDRIKTEGEESGQALCVLAYVLSNVSILLAPFMPFISDFIYKDITGNESVHLAVWPSLEIFDANLIQKMEQVRDIAEAGLSLRKEASLKVRQPLLELEYYIKEKSNILPPELEKLLAEELNVKIVSGRGDFVQKGGWAFRETSGFKAALNLEITAELKAEGRARELERLVQDLRKKSHLKPGELVDLYYNTQDQGLEEALINLFDRKKTFVGLVSKSLEVEADFETQGEVDGKAVWLGMIKV